MEIEMFRETNIYLDVPGNEHILIQGERDVVYRLQKSEFERSRRLQVRL